MMNLSELLPTVERACGVSNIIASASAEPPVVGMPDAARAPFLAALASASRAPVLVIVPRPAQSVAIAEEFSSWCGSSVPLFHFPERDALPYERLPADPEALRERLVALDVLDAAEPCLIVASGLAIAQRTLGLKERQTRITVNTGARTSPKNLVARLFQLGYCSQPLVERPGDMAHRGGIVDIYPAAADSAVRIEFFGDNIESIRVIDVSTQRSTARINTTTVAAAREVLDLPAAVEAFAAEIDLSPLSEEFREQFEEELGRLKAGDAISQESFYVPLLAQGTLLDHLAENALLVIDQTDELAAALDEHDKHVDEVRLDLEGRGELPPNIPLPHVSAPDVQRRIERHPRRLHLSRWAVDTRDDEDHTPDSITSIRLPFTPADSFGGRIRSLAAAVDDWRRAGRATVIASQQAQRLTEVLTEDGVPASLVEAPLEPEAGTVSVVQGTLPQGWRISTATPPLTLLTDAEVFGFMKQRRRLPKGSSANRDLFLAALTSGDHVVHIEHGIARFAGLVRRSVGDVEREYLELHYAAGDKLYVPAEQVDRISRFAGGGDQPPSLTRLGSQEWSRTKERVRRAVADLARELLDLYASRHVIEGHAFSTDTPWQQELEASFPYVETPDQLAAVRSVKTDMERPQPMDRLVCGDVGYGKTEVALRAAFKAVMDGTQVAVLVPTTVLAQQHFNTFQERLVGFPVRVDMLSRFRSKREQVETIAALREGSVDIVIGTHRLLQKDIAFKNLGLVIIDEEQRFGVAHKERLKQVRRAVDVLTLSATPIPRTLHMSLSGIRDMSTIETPPEQRLPIKTYVTEYDDHIVREAILRELERGGQVYFVHNRVHDIEMIAAQLRKLVPEAEIGTAHGQQDEDILERAMLQFVDGKVDVLVCTTIIESGLDIPNVNTIIIHKADKLGLAQLYQLRGRVGRSAARAYAYLLFEKYRSLSGPAQKRLQAVFEATELGAGFQIAQRDLEIRGAGNLLGADQSGHIGAVGFDLYIKLLSDAVERLKAFRDGRTLTKPRAQQQLMIDLPLAAHLPESYVPDLNVRLALYQRMAAVETIEQYEALQEEMCDRFGAPPPAVERLLYIVEVRALARAAGVSSVQQREGMIIVQISEGPSPRATLANLASDALWLGQTQARIDLKLSGDSWPNKLLDLLRRLTGPGDRIESESVAIRSG